MIRVNLLPAKETHRAIGRRQQLSVAALGLAVTLLMMVVPYMMQGRRLALLERDIAATQQEIARYSQQVKEVGDLDRMKRDLEAKLRIIEDLNNKRVGPARVLTDLSGAVPENLWLVDFKEVGGDATLTGIALDNQTIAAFMRQLEGSAYFYAVDLDETAQSRPVVRRGAVSEPLPFTRFIVRARVDYFGRGGQAPTDGEPAPDQAPPGGTG